ncbi:MAG: nucleoside deaminase [Firmicutes bacterium]|nr:nucleoside deaminase [Bacillota bacterium]
MYIKDAMEAAAKQAKQTMNENKGGPFGAAVVKDGKIIAVASNSVLCDKDPTAHAEVNAIRLACKKLDTYDLKGCEIYATGYPCPMCLSAIIWANIKKAYVSGNIEDAESIGFRDDFIYKYIESGKKDKNILSIDFQDEYIAKALYSEYAEKNKTIY